jgi:hypothetical protein
MKRKYCIHCEASRDLPNKMSLKRDPKEMRDVLGRTTKTLR